MATATQHVLEGQVFLLHRHTVPFVLARMLSPNEMAKPTVDAEGCPSTLGDQVRKAWMESWDEWYCFRNAKVGAAHVSRLQWRKMIQHLIAVISCAVVTSCMTRLKGLMHHRVLLR